MCPIKEEVQEVSKEEEVAIIEEAEKGSPEEEVSEEEEVLEEEVETEFSGVDKVEDIPEGKEKDYGI